LYTGISLDNDWPWPATIERIRLVNATPGFRLVEAKMALPGTAGGMAGAMAADSPELAELGLDTDYGPLPADLAGHNELGEGRVSIEVIADQAGEYRYDAVAVDYRVGPFTFTVVHHQAFGACLVPLLEGTTCPSEQPVT
jgi:hypothetical protein